MKGIFSFPNKSYLSCSLFLHFFVHLMASSSSIDLPTQLEYYAIRDTLLGHNHVKKDMKRALELASTCQHPEAQWLSHILAGKDVTTKEEARDVFLAQGDDDARALCFSALFSCPPDQARLRRAAEMGFAFAQAQLGLATYEEMFSLSLRASLPGERDGFLFLGLCYERGKGCERDEIKAKKNYLRSAELNYVDAMVRCGLLLEDKDPQRWHWWGLAAARGTPFSFLYYFGAVVDRFDSEPALAPSLFIVGRALKGHIDAERELIFGESSDYDSRIGSANQALAFFSFQCAAARTAVDTWCLIARRMGNNQINRDIRKKIGILIWKSRELGNYKKSSADEAASQSK